jgi:hypothetical protein
LVDWWFGKILQLREGFEPSVPGALGSNDGSGVGQACVPLRVRMLAKILKTGAKTGVCE